VPYEDVRTWHVSGAQQGMVKITFSLPSGEGAMMCTCGHSEKDHAPCGKCLVEGCECEVLERQKA
jgi:hypothetical protein